MGMKCISCDTDNNLRERTANLGRCKNCGHTFAFEPSTVTQAKFKFTDKFFAKAIADISANGTLYFTPKQLLYFLSKRLTKKTDNINNFFFLFGFLGLYGVIIGVLESTKISLIGIISIIIGIILVFTAVVISAKPRLVEISQDQFNYWLYRWQQVNDPIDKILPSLRDPVASNPVNSDISAYSFDRAVICDSAEIAQLLIANNFHFENNCAVLSITGYPQSIFSFVMQMLRRNPELKVYALHDASLNGVTLVHRLRTSPDWFENSNVMIYNVGLLPGKLLKNRKLFVQTSEELALQAQQLPDQVRQNLSSTELKWLEQVKYVELEFFSPQGIIKILNKGIYRSQDSTDSFG